MIEQQLTDNQKINFHLFWLEKNLKYGCGFLFVGFLMLIQCLTAPAWLRDLYFIISSLGIWAILIALFYVSNRDKKFIEGEIKKATKPK